jgi:hypothetical protein
MSSIQGPSMNDSNIPSKIPPTSGPTGNYPTDAEQKQPMDPGGIWSKFLSQSGVQATPDQVKMFLQQFEKMLQLQVKKQMDAWKRAADAFKKSLRDNE